MLEQASAACIGFKMHTGAVRKLVNDPFSEMAFAAVVADERHLSLDDSDRMKSH